MRKVRTILGYGCLSGVAMLAAVGMMCSTPEYAYADPHGCRSIGVAPDGGPLCDPQALCDNWGTPGVCDRNSTKTQCMCK